MERLSPQTVRVYLDSNEDEWSLLEKNIITFFRADCIFLDTDKNIKVKIEIAVPPDKAMKSLKDKCRTVDWDETSEFLYEYVSAKRWIFGGEIEGNKIPQKIVISYFSNAKTSICYILPDGADLESYFKNKFGIEVMIPPKKIRTKT